MAPNTRSVLPEWMWLWVPCLLVLTLPAARLIGRDFHERWFNVKEGPIEWLTVAVLLPAIWAGIRAWQRRSLLPRPWLGACVLVWTAAAIYVAGEELSWGQTLFGWQTPESFRPLNQQSETNLHNLSSWLNEKPRTAFELWVLIGGLIMPLRLRKHALGVDDWRAWFWPPMLCVPTALVALLVRLPDRIEKLAGDFTHPMLADMRLSEPQEFYFAYFLMIFLLSFEARLRAVEEASAGR